MATLKISTIIPYFNAHNTIQASLHSILDSTAEVDEVIIVNDGSSLESGEVLQATLQKINDSRIKSFDHKHNLGGGAARNTAVLRSRNDWIFCLDSDNLVPPGLLAELSESVKQLAPKVQVFVPETIAFFENSMSSFSHIWHMNVSRLSINDFLTTAVVPASSGNYLFSRESWERSGCYPSKSGALDAWGFGLRQFAAGYVPFAVPDTNYFHRIATDSYYVRDSVRMDEMSLRATALVLEHASILKPEQLRYILGPCRPTKWFGKLKTHQAKSSERLPDAGFSMDRRFMDSGEQDSLDTSLQAVLTRSGLSHGLS